MQVNSPRLAKCLKNKSGEFMQASMVTPADLYGYFCTESLHSAYCCSYKRECTFSCMRLVPSISSFFILQLYVKDEGGRNWVKAPLDSNSFKYDSGSVLSVLPEMCSQGRHKRLSDFDDHLNDISRFGSLPCAA